MIENNLVQSKQMIRKYIFILEFLVLFRQSIRNEMNDKRNKCQTRRGQHGTNTQLRIGISS